MSEGKIFLKGFEVRLSFSNRKSVGVTVKSPGNLIVVNSPYSYSIDRLQMILCSKSPWIFDQAKKLSGRIKEQRRLYVDGEVHYLRGLPLVLKIKQSSRVSINVFDREIILSLPDIGDFDVRERLVDLLYKEKTLEDARKLVGMWESRIGVKVNKVEARSMSARWGSCSTHTAVIRFNSELARKPIECFEYVVVHEMTHLLERNHTRRFWRLVSSFLPDWEARKNLLNSLPLKYEHWKD